MSRERTLSEAAVGAAHTDCEHGTADTHSVMGDDGRRVWRCSDCDRTGTWGARWKFYGAPECKQCGRAVVNRVLCGECASGEARKRDRK